MRYIIALRYSIDSPPIFSVNGEGNLLMISFKKYTAFLTLVVLQLFGSYVFAQTQQPKHSILTTFSGSIGAKEQNLSLAIGHNIGIGKLKKFKIGYGLRLNSYFGSAKEYITAPAKLTSSRQDLGTIFSETIESNLDTVSFGTSQVNYLNLFINLEYQIAPKWALGFNIDAAGFSFGGNQKGILTTSLDGKNGTSVTAKPTTSNLLLTSDNDIGSLNSELFVRYKLTNKWALQGGITFLFTEYKTSEKVVLDNDRFRHKSLMGMVGISYLIK